MRHIITKAKRNKKQQQALAKSSNILERMSKRKTSKRKEMPSIFRLTPKKNIEMILLIAINQFKH